MKNIDLTCLLIKLINDYEQIYGMQTFEIKKINNLFIHSYINPNIVESFKSFSSNCSFTTGIALSNFPISKDFKEKMLINYEIAWNGKDIVNFDFLADCEMIILYSLKAIQKSGRTEKLEGHCILLDGKEFYGAIKSFN